MCPLFTLTKEMYCCQGIESEVNNFMSLFYVKTNDSLFVERSRKCEMKMENVNESTDAIF